MGEALEQGAGATHGARQSKDARQTAAARPGEKCHLLLENRTGYGDAKHQSNGNVLLDQLHRAPVAHCAPSADMNAALAGHITAIAGTDSIHLIPGVGSNATGALGYVNAAYESVAQSEAQSLSVTHVAHATARVGPQVGWVAGVKAADGSTPVLRIGARAPKETQYANLYRLTQATDAKLGNGDLADGDDAGANCDDISEGYGLPASSTIEAIRLVTEHEGILLEPVSSGKAKAGLIRSGALTKDHRVLFVHTDGSVALFGYAHRLEAPVSLAPVSLAAE